MAIAITETIFQDDDGDLIARARQTARRVEPLVAGKELVRTAGCLGEPLREAARGQKRKFWSA